MRLGKTPNFHDRGGAENTAAEPGDNGRAPQRPLRRTVAGIQRLLPYLLFGVSTAFLVCFPACFGSGSSAVGTDWAHGLYVPNVIALLLVIRESGHRRDAEATLRTAETDVALVE